MSLPLSVGTFTEGLNGQELVNAVRRLDDWGYDHFWLPEISGREPFATAAYLLANTRRLGIGTGIANCYVRDATAAAQGANTLAEFSSGRFTLGLGASHPGLVEPRGHQWQAPLPKLRTYLQDLRAATVTAPPAAEAAPVLIAAHGPKLLQLAAEHTDGVFMYMQPNTAVKAARKILGPDKQLHAVIRCICIDDQDRGRDIARRALAFYLQLPAYHNAWRAAGFDESDWAQGGSDRLIDAICPCGDPELIREYAAAVIDSGASHIILSPCHPAEEYDGVSSSPLMWDWNLLEALAPAQQASEKTNHS